MNEGGKEKKERKKEGEKEEKKEERKKERMKERKEKITREEIKISKPAQFEQSSKLFFFLHNAKINNKRPTPKERHSLIVSKVSKIFIA